MRKNIREELKKWKGRLKANKILSIGIAIIMIATIANGVITGISLQENNNLPDGLESKEQQEAYKQFLSDWEKYEDNPSWGSTRLTDTYTATDWLKLPNFGNLTFGADYDVEAYYNATRDALEWNGSIFTNRLNNIRIASEFATVQDAIDDLPSEGGEVLINEMFDETVDLSGKSHITLQGLGLSTGFNNTEIDGSHAIRNVNIKAECQADIVIKDMMIKGNDASGNGIHFECVAQSLIHNVFVHHNGGYGLYWNGVEGYNPENGEFLGNPIVANSQFYRNGEYGIYCDSTHDLILDGLAVEENLGGGIYYKDGRDFKLGCSEIEDHKTNELVLDGVLEAAIQGCNLENHGNEAVIKLLRTCKLITISGNSIWSQPASGASRAVYVTGAIEGLIISNNVMRPSSAMVSISGTADRSDVVIIGNTVGMLDEDIEGIFLTSVDNAVIASNSIYAAGVGIYLGDCTNVIVESNLIRVRKTGEELIEANALVVTPVIGEIDTVHISNNIINKYSGDDMVNGIYIVGGTNVKVQGNRVHDATTKIKDEGTRTEIVNNPEVNPFGVITNPFDTTNNLIHITGDAAAPAASTVYTVCLAPCRIISTDSGNTDCSIEVKDKDGNSIESGLSIYDNWLEPCWTVNWGTFTGTAPTVTVIFK